MFLLALIYLIILVVAFLGLVWDDPRVVRLSGVAQWVLFFILGIAVFWSVLNR